ncbi:MAG: hypothetical protein AAFV98_05870 [Chloroflexota bacterium]
MADSLFDNRYRYDYIYPRGRSGETLRAVDTRNDERKVVIKRPAPNDAPPIRAGQEVSISNERRALQRLSGHEVLTELVDEGQFFVGGTPHQYIVMERAEGTIIADEVIELNAQGKRLPELEILIIIDRLLDLLYTAHTNDIVYNDVDAKHLFWDRDNYALSLIDWGNAVFLEGDDVTQQGISRQTDIQQVGELLYFIVTGGRRADIPRDADEDFGIDFGEDNRRVHSRVQAIISKALHPNMRLRYRTISELRIDLSNYRQPIEQERNHSVKMIAEQIESSKRTMSELRGLRNALEPLLAQDPAYPPAVTIHRQIVDRLRDLSVEADLDAVRIYMLNGNWERSAELLRELRENAGTQTGNLSNLLLDICVLLTDNPINPTPQAITDAMEQLFDGNYGVAGLTLLNDESDDYVRVIQWQLAERITSHIPDVMLLRPNLYRIDTALHQLANEGFDLNEAQALMKEINTAIDDIANGTLNLSFLRDSYRAIVEKLNRLNPLLQTFAAQHQLSTRRVPLNAIERSLNATMALADSMHIIGKQAATSPREAQNALENSRAIDPTNDMWADLEDLLSRLYDRLKASQTFVPAADGSDLEAWLQENRERLQPFQDRLFDDLLVQMVNGLDDAGNAWQTYRTQVLRGNRDMTMRALDQATRAVSTISPALSQWFRQLRSVVDGSSYIERHALPGGLGRALADGWGAFDRGRLAEAERLGQQALEIARDEEARNAASRLQDLSRLVRDWVERNGVSSQERTQTVLERANALFTPAENRVRQDFEAQMPSIDLYLKAMSKGLVATFERTSTPALRILFSYYVLQGTLDVHDGLLEDGQFWRNAATKTLEDRGTQHVAVRTLDDYITSRLDLIEAQSLFSQLTGKHILPELPTIRIKLENSAQAQTLSTSIQSLRDVELALRDWSDGDFRAAGIKLDSAVSAIDEVEKAGDLQLDGYRSWLLYLMENVATLTVRAREMRKVIEQRPNEPEDTVGNVLETQVAVTEDVLGLNYIATLRQWRDTYRQFVDVLTADVRRSRRLEELNNLFRAMFIDKHPAYPLYRHWYDVLQAQSEFAAPPTDNPLPREEDPNEIPEIVYRTREEALEPDILPPDAGNSRSGLFLFGGVIIIVVLVLGVIGFRFLTGGTTPQIEVTISATPTQDERATATEETAITTPTPEPIVPAVADDATLEVANTPTLIPTVTSERNVDVFTSTPTNTPTNTVTPSPTVPTNTPTPTFTPSITPTTPPPTNTPLPPEGLVGRQNLLNAISNAPEYPFNPSTFFGIEGGYQLETDAESTGDIIRIVPPVSLLESTYGNNAAARIQSVEADISLLTFNPDLATDDLGVFFGISLQSTRDGNTISLQVNALNNTTIEISDVQNGTLTTQRTRSVSSVVVRLRMDRDIDTGEVLMFLNDEQIGTSIDFFFSETPIVPVIYARDGGVIIRVTDWRVTLR